MAKKKPITKKKPKQNEYVCEEPNCSREFPTMAGVRKHMSVAHKKSAAMEKTIADFASKLKPAEIRFIHLYLGGEGGACWNNATRAYCVAYEKNEEDAKELKTARTLGSRLLANVDIQAYRTFLLGKHGFTEDAIKQRYGQLAMQDANLGVALGSTDRMAKIAGVLKDDGMKIDIPQLNALGADIKKILSGK